MLVRVTDLAHPLAQKIADDPVRPEIPADFRISEHTDFFVLMDTDESVRAAVCVAYKDAVPSSVQELFDAVTEPTKAIFYTIWSYAKGAGQELILEAKKFIETEHPEVDEFVTLSPKTDMAERFHLKNGASVFRNNDDSVNYQYK